MIKIVIGRKNMIIALLASCLFFISGCGKVSYDTNTLVFNKDGSIEEYLVENFDESVYSIDELRKETEDYAASYNKSAELISFSEMKVTDGVLRCSVKYADDDAYYDFNNTAIYYGTVEKALKAGFNLKNVVKAVDGGKDVNLSSDKELLQSQIVILNMATDVCTYKNIKYATENVKVGNDPKKASTGGGMAYIVFD